MSVGAPSATAPMAQQRRLADRSTQAPQLFDAGAAAARLSDLVAQAQADPASAPLPAWLEAGPVRALVLGIADHSPYLWRLAASDPPRLLRLLDTDPDARLDAILAAISAGCDHATDEADVMRSLRRAKQEVALLVALTDLSGAWTLADVTAALSRFADAAVSAAVDFLLRQAARAGKLTLADPAAPATGSGVVVLALGKHGARELNYSSDVDLVVFFDPAARALADGIEPAPFFVKLTKGLVRLLQERTPDGYVLRVDLRLRPDPGSTTVAIALPSAFAYYEILGQNWERAAWIKARPVAGDRALGQRFIADLAPFIWRKYFDYGALADIHAMKRQIHAVRGHAEVAVAGHDVKLGRGGIREIEFFVQTQQLVFGGRRPQLRGPRTLDMLAELNRDGWITVAAADELAAAYVFLRTIEHRLQMLADEQTQRLPADDDGLARFAAFCGFATLAGFADALRNHLHRVEAHYAKLFEHAPELATAIGSLVFTGVADDPDTLETLRGLGFKQPAAAAEMVRGWHFGRRPAVRSARAREILTELVPSLLEAFSGSGDPDAALVAFDAALARMPAAVELFSLLKSNAAIRELFADILGAAPRLARIVAMRPHVLDAAIDPAHAAAHGPALEARVAQGLQQAAGFEDYLDRARDVRIEEGFLIDVKLLSGAMTPTQAAEAYSALAETIVRLTLMRVESEFAREHGAVPGGRCVVLGLGKLGSREMSAGSDLDLILVYDFDTERPASDGARPLHAVQYYARLTQRLVSALTVPTRRGPLYAVDLRLRPSGNKGPVATQLESFLGYQRSAAETWEHMALTRARVVAGDAALGEAVRESVAGILAQARDPRTVAKDVRDMRKLIAQAKGEGGDFDLKIAPGGLIDIEFIAQYLVLAYAHDHPGLLQASTRGVLRAAADAGVIAAPEADALVHAHVLIADVVALIGTCVEGELDPQAAPEGVRRRIAAALSLPDFRAVESDLAEARASVQAIFAAVLRDK